MKSTFGVLGTGRMGVRLAVMLADAGHDVVLGSRDVSRGERICAGLRRASIHAGDYHAAAGCELVIPAMFIRDGMFSTLEPLRETLNDRIAVRFQSEWHDADGRWHRSSGNELWQFDESGLMRHREASINDLDVAVVKDAAATPRRPQIGDGNRAAVINYGFLANAVMTTDKAVKAIM